MNYDKLKTYTASDIKSNLTRIFDDAKKEPVVITKRSSAPFILMQRDHLDSYIDKKIKQAQSANRKALKEKNEYQAPQKETNKQAAKNKSTNRDQAKPSERTYDSSQSLLKKAHYYLFVKHYD